jgi:hypothetical protein
MERKPAENLVKCRLPDIYEVLVLKAIDRIMSAYRRVHQLTEEQAAIVQKELLPFISDMLGEKPPKPPKSN